MGQQQHLLEDAIGAHRNTSVSDRVIYTKVGKKRQIGFFSLQRFIIYPFPGIEGRTSILLGRERGFICNKSFTSSPISSGWIFQASASPKT